MQLLHPAGNPQCLTGVAEVSSNLAHHGGNCEGDEIGSARGIETVDGVDQTETRHLNQIVVCLATTVESSGDVLGQR